MSSRRMVDVTSQRIEETELAIAEQRRYVAGLDDPDLRRIAARTLATLEDMLLIMERTRGILIERDLPGAASTEPGDRSRL